MNTNRAYTIGIGVLAGLLAACSNGSHDIQSLPPNMVSYHYSSKIDVAHVQPGEKALAEKINAGEPLDFRSITDLLIKKNLVQYQTVQSKKDEALPDNSKPTAGKTAPNTGSTLPTVVISAPKWDGVKRMEQLAAAAGTADYLALKSAYEAKIETNKTPIMYQKDATTIFDITERQRMQCFSGTNLNLVMARLTRDGSTYRAQHYVVIVKPGHVLPGEMIQTKQGYDLVGVETTASGSALVDMGLTNDLSAPMRIVDAEDYVIAELFGAQLPKSFIQESLHKTEKEYGVPRAQLEKAIVADWQKNTSGGNGTKLSRDAMSGNLSEMAPSTDPYNSSMFDFAPPEPMPATAIARSPVGESEAQFNQTLASLNAPIVSVAQLSLAPAVLSGSNETPDEKMLDGKWVGVEVFCASGHAFGNSTKSLDASNFHNAAISFRSGELRIFSQDKCPRYYFAIHYAVMPGDRFLYEARSPYLGEDCDGHRERSSVTIQKDGLPDSFSFASPDQLVLNWESEGHSCPVGDTIVTMWARVR